MAIFGIIEIEELVQTGEKVRINCTKSFVSKDSTAVTLVRIKPSASDSFITVTGTSSKDWYLDWSYPAAASVTVELEITTNAAPIVFSKALSVVTPATDGLWSKDSDLISYEADLLKWVPEGKSSFNNIHRQAQSLILDWLDHIRVWKNDGTKLIKTDILVTSDVKQLSIFWSLYLIFQNMSNKPDDVFAVKAAKYKTLMESTKSRGRIQADINGDAELTSEDGIDMKSFRIFRR